MDPFSRKLFTTRDAREHLRSMGGILSSSPRLAETVAKFQDGGDVRPPVTYNEWMQMSRSERERAGLPVSLIGANRYFNRFGVGMGLNDPETGERIPSALTMEEAAMGEFGGLPPEMVEPRGTVEETLPGQGVFPSDIAFGAGQALGLGPALEAAGIERPSEVRAASRAADIAPMPTPEVEEVPEVERVPSPETEEPPPAEAERPTAPASSLSSTGAALASGNFDTSYEQMLARLENVMGERNEDSRKKAMANLAMIGLAIAAGQSPDALTNIAQGALVGMKGIQEAEAAEKAQEREMRLAALRMAADEVSLTRRLQSEERIAGLRAAGGSGTYTPERLYQQNLSAILSNPDMFDVFAGDTVDPVRARLLAEQLSERGVSLGTADQQFTPGQIVVQDGVTFEYQQDGTWKRAGG
jgi:hypothetical protein